MPPNLLSSRRDATKARAATQPSILDRLVENPRLTSFHSPGQQTHESQRLIKPASCFQPRRPTEPCFQAPRIRGSCVVLPPGQRHPCRKHDGAEILRPWPTGRLRTRATPVRHHLQAPTIECVWKRDVQISDQHVGGDTPSCFPADSGGGTLQCEPPSPQNSSTKASCAVVA